MSKNRYNIFSNYKVTHRGKTLKTVTPSPRFYNYPDTVVGKSNLIIVPSGFRGRPDLLSFHVYGTPDYWWLLLLANDIVDPYEELKEGIQLKIPKVL